FFGAAEKAMGAIAEFSGRPYPRAIILYMGDVPVVDMTGLVALQSVIRRVRSLGAMLVLTGVQRQPLKAMEKAGIHEDPGHVMICHTISEAEMIVRLVDPPQAPVAETTAHA
ncbi:MAG: STAS domain-containing protein, partial [Phycisphaeraceae bacterium]|nr:STAS domain-containing protein [Phycisphaeraceae bacterium]